MKKIKPQHSNLLTDENDDMQRLETEERQPLQLFPDGNPHQERIKVSEKVFKQQSSGKLKLSSEKGHDK